jgi:hypothetical protein
VFRSFFVIEQILLSRFFLSVKLSDQVGLDQNVNIVNIEYCVIIPTFCRKKTLYILVFKVSLSASVIFSEYCQFFL